VIRPGAIGLGPVPQKKREKRQRDGERRELGSWNRNGGVGEVVVRRGVGWRGRRLVWRC